MTRFLLALLLTGLSGAAWGQHTTGDSATIQGCCISADGYPGAVLSDKSGIGALASIPNGSIGCPPVCASGGVPESALPHRYTVDEIDRMRTAIRARTAIEHAATSGPTYVTLGWTEYAPDAVIEDRLRTYMSQGIRPEELEGKVKP